MARKKEMYLVIDTETCNTLEQPLVYDIGYAIADLRLFVAPFLQFPALPGGGFVI